MEISSKQLILTANGKQNANAFKKNNNSYLSKLFNFLLVENIWCPDCKEMNEHYSAG